MKKKYIADVLDVDIYASWIKGEKVLISAPTGAGKTTFMLRKLLPYCKQFSKKMLILCNRRLLLEQYGFDLAEYYARYTEMCGDVEVWTYQQLAEKIRLCPYIKNLFQEFDVIVCDEVHFFYADSDFNAFGTFCLLQALIIAGFYKSMIMITATMDEVKPLIIQTFKSAAERLEKEDNSPNFENYKFQNSVFAYPEMANYEHFKCCWLPDMESLANEIAGSSKKSIVFIDDKNMAEKFRNVLIETEKVRASDVFILNADILDESKSDPVIISLAITNKLIPKILLTTSVLDNGVSIHDASVGNIVIATDSKVSFLQMIGRVRTEETSKCNLFIFPRDIRYYERRKTQYEEKVKLFDRLDKSNLLHDDFELLVEGWYGNDESSEFFRNSLVITQYEYNFYKEKPCYASIRRDGMLLAINEFAREKTGNMLLTLKEFYKLALEAPVKVAEKQVSWIGKEANELDIMTSSYKEKRTQELIGKLLEVKNFSNDELQEFKNNISKKYRGDLIGDIVLKNGSFSTDKLIQICERYGLELQKVDGEDKKLRYTIIQADSKQDLENKED